MMINIKFKFFLILILIVSLGQSQIPCQDMMMTTVKIENKMFDKVDSVFELKGVNYSLLSFKVDVHRSTTQYVLLPDSSKSGNYLIHFESSVIFSKFSYVNNSLHGNLLSYWDNGRLKQHAKYKNGIRTSMVNYRRNGKILSFYELVSENKALIINFLCNGEIASISYVNF